MKNTQWKFRIAAAVALIGALVLVQSCDEDEPPVAPTLSAATAGGVDINGATAPNTVPVDATITITFSTDIDASTATAENVKLVRKYDEADLPGAINTAGAVITFDPTEVLTPGVLYTLTLGAGLKSTGGVALTELTRTFTTAGTFAPPGARHHWTFEDNANDVIGTLDAEAAGVIAVTYGASHNTAAGKAAVFNGTSSIIEIANGDQVMNPAGSWTISFWAKPVSEGHVNAEGNPKGHFVLGLGAYYGFQLEINGAYDGGQFPLRYALAGSAETASEGFGYAANGQDAAHGGWQGWEFRADMSGSGGLPNLLKDKWVHVVYTFDAPTKKVTLFFNGQRIQTGNFNLWPADAPVRNVAGTKFGGLAPDVYNDLAFGFIQSRRGALFDNESYGNFDLPTANHFRGSLDDVQIFHRSMTNAEVTLIYNSGK